MDRREGRTATLPHRVPNRATPLGHLVTLRPSPTERITPDALDLLAALVLAQPAGLTDRVGAGASLPHPAPTFKATSVVCAEGSPEG